MKKEKLSESALITLNHLKDDLNKVKTNEELEKFIRASTIAGVRSYLIQFGILERNPLMDLIGIMSKKIKEEK